MLKGERILHFQSSYEFLGEWKSISNYEENFLMFFNFLKKYFKGEQKFTLNWIEFGNLHNPDLLRRKNGYIIYDQEDSPYILYPFGGPEDFNRNIPTHIDLNCDVIQLKDYIQNLSNFIPSWMKL
ncbi:MAG: hypothetical protein ACTSVI_08445 [Promethearchaeota archaeon]